jgi:predicted kinase
MYARQHSGPTDPRVGPALVHLIVGLPGAGKTSHAKELEVSASALRLTPDESQIALFGGQNPPDERDLVEGKLIQLGMRAAELGVDVVFDFGSHERRRTRAVAGSVPGAGRRGTARFPDCLEAPCTQARAGNEAAGVADQPPDRG